MLAPIAQAMQQLKAEFPSSSFRMVFGGEHHFTLTFAPSSYNRSAAHLKAAYPAVQLGWHFAYYMLCPENCAKLNATMRGRVNETLSKLDFMSMSLYPVVGESFEPIDLGGSLAGFGTWVVKAQLGFDHIAAFAGELWPCWIWLVPGVWWRGGCAGRC